MTSTLSQNKHNSSAIVLARGINGLGVVRSLGLKGINSCVISSQNSHYISKSKYVSHFEILENASDERIIEKIDQLADPDSTIIGASDEFIAFLERNQNQLTQKYRFVLPGENIGSLLNDKCDELKFINKIGLPAPKSFYSLSEALQHALPSDYPLLVKPRVFEYIEELGEKNKVTNDPESLKTLIDDSTLIDDHYIVQSIIEGDDENLWVCNCFTDNNSNLTASFVFNRIRTTPAHYGVTSFAVSKENPEIIAHTQRILKALNYKGPAMIEFKFDPKDQQYKYIEINPRLGMCNFYDTLCGVNNVYNTFALANSLPLQPSTQKNDVYFLSLIGDLTSRINDNEPMSQIFKSYLRILLKSRVGAFWWWKDPMPGLSKGFSYLSLILSKLLRTLKIKKT